MIAKAKERLALAADDAVSTLIRIMTDPKVSPSDRRQAATALLDRAGINTKAELDITIAPWVGVLEGVVAEAGDGQEVTRTHDYSTRLGPMAELTNQAPAPAEDIVDAEVIDEPSSPVVGAVPVDGRKPDRPRARAARIVRD